MANADKPSWQYVQQKAAQEFVDVEGQKSLLVFVGGVPPTERHFVVYKRDEAVVGNRNAMSIGAEIAKHLLGSAERWFAVDYPAERVELVDQASKQLRLSQAAKHAVELKLSGGVCLLKRFQELAAEDFTQNSLREEEPITARTHPLRVIPRQAARSYDAVNVGMMLEFLIPGVEDAEESDFGAEMLGVCRDLDQRLGTATE
jgi:hypothetical protein